jgi:2-polyprenyl-3-methyl-5-hydroxy-6-metoxy-1,4-benzoquinol methylase
MSFSAIWHRRLKYMLTPQFDLYAQIAQRFCGTQGGFFSRTVLDYGCGLGFGSVRLSTGGSVVLGIDRDREAIAFAHEVLGGVVVFAMGDAIGGGMDLDVWRSIKAQERQFGLVTVIEVIEHLDPRSQGALVAELSSVVIDHGILVLSTPNKRSHFRKHDGHIGMHDPASLRDLLAPHFEDVAFEDYLGEALPDDTSVSPLVAVCRRPRRV